MNYNLDEFLKQPDDILDPVLKRFGYSAADFRRRAHISPFQTSKFIELMTDESLRMMHYTKPDNAINIASSKSIWLNSARLMEDTSEISYGYRPLLEFINSDIASEMWRVLNNHSPGISDRIKGHIEKSETAFIEGTYIFCLTVQKTEAPDGTRKFYDNYGQVAAVIKPDPMSRISDALWANTYPVRYKNFNELAAIMNELAARIVSNPAKLEYFDGDQLLGHMLLEIQQLVFATKDPFYINESEWRIVHNPKLSINSELQKGEADCDSEHAKYYILELKDYPEADLNLEIHRLIERVLIKKSEDSSAVKQRLIECNEEYNLGFDNSVFQEV